MKGKKEIGKTIVRVERYHHCAVALVRDFEFTADLFHHQTARDVVLGFLSMRFRVVPGVDYARIGFGRTRRHIALRFE